MTPLYFETYKFQTKTHSIILNLDIFEEQLSSADKTFRIMASKILLLISFFALLSPLWSLPLPPPDGKSSFSLIQFSLFDNASVDRLLWPFVVFLVYDMSHNH